MRLHPLTHPDSRSFLFCLNKTSVKSRPSSASNSAVAPILLRVKANVWTTAHGPVPSGPHLVLSELLSHSFPPSLSQPVTWPSSLVLTHPTPQHSVLALGLGRPRLWLMALPGAPVPQAPTGLTPPCQVCSHPSFSDKTHSNRSPPPFPASTFSFLSRAQSLNG